MARCTAPLQKSSRCGGCLSPATSMATRINSPIPSFLLAEMGTTGTPSSACIFSMSMWPLLARTSSIIFSAITIGMRSSISCRLRYRLRSRLVASTMLMMPSGCESIRKSRETISSDEYGDSE